MAGTTVRQLEYFVCAAENSSIKLAGENLNTSQPAVSTALNELEKTLGAQLLRRGAGKTVTLTPAGERILPLARHVLQDMKEIEALAHAEQNRVQGRISIAVSRALSPRILPTLAEQCALKYPKLELQLFDGLADEIQNELASGKADMCLLYHRQLSHNFKLETIATLTPYAVLPQQHPLATAKKVHLKQLETERLLMVGRPNTKNVIYQLVIEAGIDARFGWTLQNPETVRAMVARGLGYSIFSGKPRGNEAFDGSRVNYVQIADRVTPNNIVLATPQDIKPSARLEAIKQLLLEAGTQQGFI